MIDWKDRCEAFDRSIQIESVIARQRNAEAME